MPNGPDNHGLDCVSQSTFPMDWTSDPQPCESQIAQNHVDGHAPDHPSDIRDGRGSTAEMHENVTRQMYNEKIQARQRRSSGATSPLASQECCATKTAVGSLTASFQQLATDHENAEDAEDAWANDSCSSFSKTTSKGTVNQLLSSCIRALVSTMQRSSPSQEIKHKMPVDELGTNVAIDHPAKNIEGGSAARGPPTEMSWATSTSNFSTGVEPEASNHLDSDPNAQISVSLPNAYQRNALGIRHQMLEGQQSPRHSLIVRDTHENNFRSPPPRAALGAAGSPRSNCSPFAIPKVDAEKQNISTMNSNTNKFSSRNNFLSRPSLPGRLDTIDSMASDTSTSVSDLNKSGSGNVGEPEVQDQHPTPHVEISRSKSPQATDTIWRQINTRLGTFWKEMNSVSGDTAGRSRPWISRVGKSDRSRSKSK